MALIFVDLVGGNIVYGQRIMNNWPGKVRYHPKLLPNYIDLILLFILIILTLRTFLIPSINGEKIYIDEDYNFRISVPENWKHVDYQQFGFSKIDQPIIKTIVFSDSKARDYIIFIITKTEVEPLNRYKLFNLNINTHFDKTYASENTFLNTKDLFLVSNQENYTITIRAKSDFQVLKRYLQTLSFN